VPEHPFLVVGLHDDKQDALVDQRQLFVLGVEVLLLLVRELAVGRLLLGIDPKVLYGVVWWAFQC
jgi:hypothetical protein